MDKNTRKILRRTEYLINQAIRKHNLIERQYKKFVCKKEAGHLCKKE